jgi:hypothetical protein
MTATVILVMAEATCALAGSAVVAAVRLRRAMRQRMKEMREVERELRLAEYSIALKPGEMIPPAESWTFPRKRKKRKRAAARLAWPARGLADAASFLLPSVDRDRYSKEFLSELWDLAQAGAGCFMQMRYALRQLRGALPMRMALRRPRRRSAAP